MDNTPAQIAKAALRRLVLDKLEPTPDNYARAYAQESGEKAPGGDDGAALATLIGKLVRGVERGCLPARVADYPCGAPRG